MQDEPANMGPSPHFRLNLFPSWTRGRDHLAARLELAVGRPAHPARRGAQGYDERGVRRGPRLGRGELLSSVD